MKKKYEVHQYYGERALQPRAHTYFAGDTLTVDRIRHIKSCALPGSTCYLLDSDGNKFDICYETRRIYRS